jgi:hypothetical protein
MYVCGSIFARSVHQRPVGGGILSSSDGVRWPDTLINNAIRYLAPKAPWELQSSQKIWAGLNHQPNQNRHVLHLVNWETDLKATNVTFTVPSDSEVGAEATVVWPTKQILRPVLKQGDRIYVVPEVGPHTMVVFSRAIADTRRKSDLPAGTAGGDMTPGTSQQVMAVQLSPFGLSLVSPALAHLPEHPPGIEWLRP